MKRLVIMQGPSGSGKSTLAKDIAMGKRSAILSTNDYFMNDGEYEFDASKLGTAHAWNLNRAKRAMAQSHPLVIIDNTHTQSWEAKAYVETGIKEGYTVEFVRATHNDTPLLCQTNNAHGVPLDSIQAMFNRLEDLSVESCLNASVPWQ